MRPNDDEEAFYNALAERPEGLLNMGDAKLNHLASELIEKLRNSTTVDWQVRDSVKGEIADSDPAAFGGK